MRFATRMNALEDRALLEAFELKLNEDIISFAAGYPSEETYPIEEIKESLNRVLKTNGKEALSYCSTSGYKPLREIMQKRMADKFSMDYDIEEIIITSGSQQGVDMSGMLFVNPDEVVLFESPSYLGAVNALRAYEANLVSVDTDQDGLKIDSLRRTMEKYGDKVKLIYINPDFQNPTGRSWSPKRREEFIKEIAKWDVVVLEDGAYGELSFSGETQKPVAHYDQKGQVIYVGTFSKIFCPGLRVAWLCARKKVMEKVLLLKNTADLSSSTLTQMQMADYITNNSIDTHINYICQVYEERKNAMVDAIRKYMPQEVEFINPKGGLFLWLSLPEKVDTKVLLEKALKAGVAFIPGGSFYPEVKEDNHLRLNFSNVDKEQIEKGIKLLSEVIKG